MIEAEPPRTVRFHAAGGCQVNPTRGSAANSLLKSGLGDIWNPALAPVTRPVVGPSVCARGASAVTCTLAVAGPPASTIEGWHSGLAEGLILYRRISV